MKNVKKLVSALVAVSMIVVLLLAGCSMKEVAAKDVASALYKLRLQEDDKEAKAIGFSNSEIKTLLDKQKSSNVLNWRKTLLSAGLSADQADAEALYQAQIDAFKKLTFSVKVKNETKDQCDVVIKTATMDISGASTKASKSAIAKIQKGKVNVKSKQADIFFEEIQKEMAALEPSKEQQEFTTVFVPKKVKTTDGTVKMWMPKDIDQFNSDLVQKVQQ